MRPLVVISGGLDPLHQGHLYYIRGAYDLTWKSDLTRRGKLVVLVNGDKFLIRKKGFAFQNIDERAAIVDSIKWVDFVIKLEDAEIPEIIRLMKPDIFANGGDRSDPSSWNPEEIAACQEVGCKPMGGIGGKDKINSSSALTRRLTSL